MIVPFFISHMGCPHQCLFCDQRGITGIQQELPSAETILATISAYHEASPDKPVEAAFFGGTFTMLAREEQARLLDPLQSMLADGSVSSIRVSTRPDAVDAEVVDFLRCRGVRIVELGVQSLDDRVLAASGRGHGSEDVRSAVTLLKDAGLAVGIQMMPGLPSSSPYTDLESLGEALLLSPDFLRIYPALVLADTGLARLYEAGEYHPLSIDKAVSLCAAMLHRCMQENVPVIRIGLQASDTLNKPGNVVAGPYHPAFRQLVESELCYYLLSRLAAGIQPGTKCTIRCALSRVSDVTGQRRNNISRLAEANVAVERIEGDPRLSPLDVILNTPSAELRGNLLNDLHFDHEGNLACLNYSGPAS
jgi:histone acetyltransferase (RNA polymerase elongator complex component)